MSNREIHDRPLTQQSGKRTIGGDVGRNDLRGEVQDQAIAHQRRWCEGVENSVC
jgi:hypothetical protein